MADIKITALDNGPYLAEGALRLVDAEGNEFQAQGPFALCRCGHSGNKPFCDGTHRKVDFQSKPRAPREQAA